tara:strand:+ start:456 stop:710 length:255 start_codon:yes stop_codon:yes gene_type:complete
VIKVNDYVLITDTMTVTEMLNTAPTLRGAMLTQYAVKMSRLSEHNLSLMTAQLERMKVQHQRQLKNATYWGMAVTLAKSKEVLV